MTPLTPDTGAVHTCTCSIVLCYKQSVTHAPGAISSLPGMKRNVSHLPRVHISRSTTPSTTCRRKAQDDWIIPEDNIYHNAAHSARLTHLTSQSRVYWSVILEPSCSKAGQCSIGRHKAPSLHERGQSWPPSSPRHLRQPKASMP